MSNPAEPQLPFSIDEEFDDDGALRLVLLGELDLAAAPTLRERFRMLKNRNSHVRVDLARLEFIDSSGLHELIAATSDSRRDGWQFEIERPVSERLRRVIDIAGVRSYLWP